MFMYVGDRSRPTFMYRDLRIRKPYWVLQYPALQHWGAMWGTGLVQPPCIIEILVKIPQVGINVSSKSEDMSLPIVQL